MKATVTDPLSKAKRGRPRTITRDRIIATGIKLGLRDMTFVGVANEIGVTQAALYKWVSNLDELRSMVAEEVFLRWPIPAPSESFNLEEYLYEFSSSLWHLVYQHVGIAPYLLRLDRITDEMTRHILNHQMQMAECFDITLDQSKTLFFTIAYHCIAVADASRDDASEAADAADVAALHGFGIKALVFGLLNMDLED